MGGHALKSVVRLEASAYRSLAATVESRLKRIFPLVSVIPAYSNKESFGDLDVLVSIQGQEKNWVASVRKEFEPEQLVKNSDVVSFSFPFPTGTGSSDFQVDLISTQSDLFQAALFYFSYNDLGNLLGRLFHKMGLKFGHTGLHYVVRDPRAQHKQEILITRDPATILARLGLSYELYQSGFESLEQIFQFVASSPFFNPDIYLLSNLNHVSRIRDRKRETYNRFLNWCESYSHSLNHYEFQDKEFYLNQLLLDQEFSRQYNEILSANKTLNLASLKFNGRLVSSLTGLTLIDLGQFLRYVKQQFPTELEFARFIVGLDDPDQYIKQQFSNYQEVNR